VYNQLIVVDKISQDIGTGRTAMKLSGIDFVAVVLVVVGGLNWGLVGLFDFDLVQAILGGVPVLARLVYVLVGLAAVYTAIRSPHLAHLGEMHRKTSHSV
jgi:uncharacterized membrane protein YuzA (DUF378 family)